MTSHASYARFFLAFAILLVAAASITSAAETLRLGWGLRGFGGFEYLPRVVALAATREYASGIAVGMSLLAWLVQTRDWDEATTRSHFRPLAWRAALTSLFGYFPCLAVMLTVGALLSSSLYGVDAAQFIEVAQKTLFLDDLLAGLRSSLFELVPLLVVGYFTMPPLAASGWRLRTKIVVLWLGIGALRLVAELPSAIVALVAA